MFTEPVDSLQGVFVFIEFCWFVSRDCISGYWILNQHYLNMIFIGVVWLLNNIKFRVRKFCNPYFIKLCLPKVDLIDLLAFCYSLADIKNTKNIVNISRNIHLPIYITTNVLLLHVSILY